MRTLMMLVSLMLLSACSSKLAYNNLDWWVYWYLDDYIELNNEQEDTFDVYLKNWLSWHKTSELSRYKAHLVEIKRQVSEGALDYNTIFSHFQRARAHWERVRDEVSPELAVLAKTLDNEQVISLFAALEKDNKEEEEERSEALEKTQEERLEKRIERIEKNLTSRVGKLSKQQQQIVATYAEQFIPTWGHWLTYRRNIQNAARRIFVMRHIGENFERDLIALMQNPDAYKSDDYLQITKHNTTVMATMAAEIMSTLSQKQRETLLENIDELIQTVDNFAQ